MTTVTRTTWSAEANFWFTSSIQPPGARCSPEPCTARSQHPSLVRQSAPIATGRLGAIAPPERLPFIGINLSPDRRIEQLDARQRPRIYVLLTHHSSLPSLALKRRKSSRGRTCQVCARTRCKRSDVWQPTVSMSSRTPMMQPSRPASSPSTSSTSTTSCPTFTRRLSTFWRFYGRIARPLSPRDDACPAAGR